MRKYIILFLSSIILITGIIFSGSVINAAEGVKIYTMRYSDAERTLNASGKLQLSPLENVYSENYCIVDQIYINNGDDIEKGDELISIYELTYKEDFPYSSSELEKIITALNSGLMNDDFLNTIKEYSVNKTITASCSGRISSIQCKENEIIKPGTCMAKIVDPYKMIIPLNINESNIEKIITGQKVRINFTAIENKEFTGTITDIAKEAKQTSGLTGKETSVEITVTLSDNDSRLKPGFTADCTIIISIDKNRLIIPYEYTMQDINGEYVFLLYRQKAKKQYINTGIEYNTGIEVLNGLKEGDKIIINSNDIYDNRSVYVYDEG